MASQRRRKQQAIPPRDEDFRDARNLLQYVFRETIPGAPEPTEMQYDICDAVQSAAWLTVFGEQRVGINAAGDPYPDVAEDARIEICALRGVGKSVIGQCIGVWGHYWNPDLNILGLSASEGFAAKFSTAMLNMIRNLPPFQWLRPDPALGHRQSTLMYDVNFSPAGRQHPSMQALGIEGHITGCRFDMGLIDDVETKENSRTEIEREKLRERMGELAVIRKPRSITVVFGTSHTEESLYTELSMKAAFRRTLWPARYPNPQWIKALDKNSWLASMLARKMAAKPKIGGLVMRENPPTEPTRFNETTLLGQELQMGRSAFDMQMLLNPNTADVMRFPLKLHDFIVTDFGVEGAPLGLAWSNAPEHRFTDVETLGFSGDYLYRPSIVGSEIGKFEGTIMAIDPAGMGGDAMGVCVASLMGGMIFVQYINGLFGGFEDENLIKICQIAKKYNVRQIIPEKNLGAGMFSRLLVSKLREHYPSCGVEEINSIGQKERRIIDTLEPPMNAHRIVLSAAALIEEMQPIPGVGDEQKEYRLQHQIAKITRDKGALPHDDLVDVLAMAVSYWTARMAITTAQAQENAKAKNLEELIESWYRQSGQPIPPANQKVGHGINTQRFIQRGRALLNRR